LPTAIIHTDLRRTNTRSRAQLGDLAQVEVKRVFDKRYSDTHMSDELPCGNAISFADAMIAAQMLENRKCPCGDADHYLFVVMLPEGIE